MKIHFHSTTFIIAIELCLVKTVIVCNVQQVKNIVELQP